VVGVLEEFFERLKKSKALRKTCGWRSGHTGDSFRVEKRYLLLDLLIAQ
jgi:hypothetical protein